MVQCYVEKANDTLEYFICGFANKNKYCNETNVFSRIKTIENKAFHLAPNLKRVFFDESLEIIKQEAFRDCSDLELFALIDKSENESENESDFILNEVKIKSMKDKKNKKKSFTLETLAFANCENLHTVVLPCCKNLKIEKDAFSGCTSLRTVVIFAEEINFTENPFKECPKTLVFVCSKKSHIEQFARENGYRSICV